MPIVESKGDDFDRNIQKLLSRQKGLNLFLKYTATTGSGLSGSGSRKGHPNSQEFKKVGGNATQSVLERFCYYSPSQ